MSQGFYRNAVPKSDSSDFPSCNFEDKFLLLDTTDSRSKTSWQSEELVLYNSVFFFLKNPLCSAILLVSLGFDLQEDDAKFFEFSKSADDGSPPAGRPSKTFPEVPNEFRVSSCKQESRLIIPQ